MKKTLRKITAIALAICTVIPSMLGAAVPAYAAEAGKVINENVGQGLGAMRAKTYNAGKDKLEDEFGVTNSDILDLLHSHINDKFYLGTSYQGVGAPDESWYQPELDDDIPKITKYAGGTDWRSPHGDVTDTSGFPGKDDVKGQAAMNCTGFVWDVIMRAQNGGADSVSNAKKSKAKSEIPCFGGVGAGKWSEFLKAKNVEYRTYVTDNWAGKADNAALKAFMKAVVADGYIAPGDLIWIWRSDVDWSDGIGDEEVGESSHVGIYIGGIWDNEKVLGGDDGKYFRKCGDIQWWHSSYRNKSTAPGRIGAYNAVNMVTPKDDMCCMSVIKFSDQGKVKLKKASADTGITNGNDNYSLEGAKYGVYSDKGCTKKAATLVTGENGESEEVELSPGNYWIKETKASEGYKLDPDVYPVTVSGGETSIVSVKEVPETGKAKLKKVSANTAITDGNKCYSLEGAKYGVYTDAGCTNQKAVLTTNAQGDSNEVELPLGGYWVKEIDPPTGYVRDDERHGPYRIKAGETTTVKVEELPGNDPIRIDLNKLDSVTGAFAQGGAELAGAEFTIKYYDGYYTKANLPASAKKTWVIKTVKQANGKYTASLSIPECKAGGDDYYISDNKVVLPLGTISIQETKAPTGYLLEGSFLKNVTTGETIKDNDLYVAQITQENIGEEAHFVGGNKADSVEFQIGEVVKRGDITLRKVDGETQKKMAGVEFKLTNKATGESHTFVTDANGEYSTENSFAKHSHNTNGGKDGDGIWFEMAEDGHKAPVDDKLGALQYGEYEIEELKGANNGGKVMYKDTFTLARDSYTIKMNNLENHDDVPTVGTTAVGADTQDHFTKASDEITIIDTVSYSKVKPGTEYTVTGKLMSKLTGEQVKDDDGKPVTSTVKFIPESEEGTVEVTFKFSGKKLAGDSVVAFETLSIGKKVVASHEDIEDEGQTVDFPGIGTEAVAENDTKYILATQETVKITDTVKYTNLIPGKEYVLTGSLVDQKTGKAVKLKDESFEKTRTFTPETADGTVTLEFELDPEAVKGLVLVAFEDVSLDGVSVGEHKEPDDEPQTVYAPEIGTTAQDIQTETHVGSSASLKDIVAYKGLKAGETYQLKAYLINKETGEAEAEGTAEFAAEAAEGKTAVEMEAPEDFKGKTYVFYEELYLPEDVENDKEELLLAEHKDLSDEGQSIHYPKIGTKALDGLTKTQTGAAGKTTIVDTVEYKNLIPGQEYTIAGVLMDKETGKELTQDVEEKEGIVDKVTGFFTGKDDKTEKKELTASVTFTPEQPDGTVDLTYELDASALQGKTIVVFEDLIVKGVTVTSHSDIEDGDQSIYYPGVKTTAVDTKTQEHVTEHSKKATITDRVEYTNLIAGHKYTITGKLMDQSTGKPLLDKDGKEHTASVTFEAGSEPGYEVLKAQDGSEYFHVFEGVDGNFYFKAVDGKYVSCGEDGTDVENPVTAEESRVKAEKAAEGKTVSGSVDLVYTVDTTLLAGKTTVVFEDLFYEGIKIATHSDIKDESQSVYTPEVKTTATAGGKHSVKASKTTKIVDKVEYKNLVPGLEYTVTGTLMDKKTGDAVAAETKPVTFKPEKASGSVNIEFVVDTTSMGGKTLVAFEELACKGTIVAEHKDLKDKDQSVSIKGKNATGTSVQTGDYIKGIVLLLAAGAVIAVIGLKLRRKK